MLMNGQGSGSGEQGAGSWKQRKGSDVQAVALLTFNRAAEHTADEETLEDDVDQNRR